MNQRPDKPDKPSGGLRLSAVDVQGIDPSALSWDQVRQGIDAAELPTCVPGDFAANANETAVLSWRWDRDENSGRSRNLALVLKHAQETGVRHLFVDLISIDQNQPRELLLRDVVALANLYASIPVIAAYDEEKATMAEWSRTLNRPWIQSEIRAFCQNPTRVTYVGFRHGPENTRELSFANEVSVVRSSGYAGTALEILHGRVGMTNVQDFAEILAEFHDVVAACYAEFSREDYLLAVFLLTALYERRQQVEHDGKKLDYGFRTELARPEFETIGLKRFSIGPYDGETRSYEWAKTLCLDGKVVAVWRTKMTSSFDRNWIEVLPEAEARIFDAVKLSEAARTAYREKPSLRTAFLRIDQAAPTPSIAEAAASLDEGRWREEIPLPNGETVGFVPDLWQ